MPDAQPRSDLRTTPEQEDRHSQTAASDGKKPGLIRRHPVAFGLGLLAVLLLAVVGYVYWLRNIHPYETTDDAFIDSRQFSLAAKVTGYVIEAPVTDNQHVGAGDTLFRIDPRDYQSAVDQARAQLDSAQAAIGGFDAQIAAQRAQIDEAAAEVQQAEASLTFAREDATRYQDLQARGSGTVQQSQQSTANLRQQQANLTRANAGVIAAQRQIGALEAQRAGAVANLAEVKARLAKAELDLACTTVTAAQPGRVVQLAAGKGQFAQAGQSLAMFVPDEVWVTANFKETQITDMRPGQPVDIRIDAYPAQRVTGHLDSVQPGSGTAFSLLPAENATGNYIKVVQRVPVKITVDHWPDGAAIGPGMSVVPTVTVR